MSKFKNSDSVIPFEDLLIEMFENKHDLNHLQSIAAYVSENLTRYSLVCAYTLWYTVNGYIDNLPTPNFEKGCNEL